MYRTFANAKKLSLVVAFVAAAVVLSTGQATAATVDLGVDEQPVVWPSFTDALGEQPATTSEQHHQYFVTDQSIATTPPVSAPLPPAVVTGACMLVGNFVLTQMWKHKRPI